MDAVKLGESLWKIHFENMRALEHIVEASSIRGENGLLLYLYHVGHPMFPGELTEKIGLTTGRIANILKGLERDGLIVRKPDGQDRRRVQVALTPQGEEMAKRQNAAAVEFHANLVSRLGENEALALLEMVRRIIAIMDDMDGSPQPG